MGTIAIPSLSLSSSSGGSPQAYMQFARADDSVALTLSIGSLNLLSGGPANHQPYAYAFAPYKATLTGANVTKHRLLFSWIVNGAWSTLGPVPAGVYWITGLNITAFSWHTLDGSKALTVAAGAFASSIVDTDVDTESDSETDLPLAHLVTAGAEGREVTKIRYRLNQENAGAGAWLATPGGEAIVRRFAT
jgi:hypothetical protein